MSNWKYTLDISKIWNDKEISTQDKGKAITEEIRKMVPEEWLDDSDKNNDAIDFELLNIIDWFSDLESYHGHSIVGEFDGIIEYLYDWADQTVEPFSVWPRNKMCRIRTQSYL